VEAADIRWFTIPGPDSPGSGLCLCSLHHKLFDTAWGCRSAKDVREDDAE
jgi:predicted restriction endonuclease